MNETWKGGLAGATLAIAISACVSLYLVQQSEMRAVSQPELSRRNESDRRIRSLESELKDLRMRVAVVENRIEK